MDLILAVASMLLGGGGHGVGPSANCCTASPVVSQGKNTKGPQTIDASSIEKSIIRVVEFFIRDSPKGVISRHMGKAVPKSESHSVAAK